MMVNSISSVRFCGPADTASAAKPEGAGFLDRPGAFAKPAESKPAAAAEQAPKKKSSAGKKLLATVATLVVVAAALVAGYKKDFLKVLNEAEKADAGFMKKIGSALGSAGKYISEHVYEPVVKLFSKKTSA